MICERISATEAKSSPKQGLATISTSTSPDNSRASTARCTLPPDRSPISAVGRLRLHAVAGDQLARLLAHRPGRQPPARASHWAAGRRCGTPCSPPRSCAARSRSSGVLPAGRTSSCGKRNRASARTARRARRCGRRGSGRWPDSTSISCDWPLPETPAMPTISPDMYLQVDLRSSTVLSPSSPSAISPARFPAPSAPGALRSRARAPGRGSACRRSSCAPCRRSRGPRPCRRRPGLPRRSTVSEIREGTSPRGTCA